jgi:peptidoglycan/xylan/chitin deacetylase (PgdA/CDA1 family)
MRYWNALAGRLLGPSFAWRACRADGLDLPAPRTFVLSFDVEMDEDARALALLLEILSAEGWPAVFASVGEVVERNPDAHRAAAAPPHEVVNHGGRQHTHPADPAPASTFFYDRAAEGEIVEDIRRGDAALRRLGAAPVGFRIPHFATCGPREREIVRREIARLGYRYSSSSVAGPFAGRLGREGGIWEVPLLPCPAHPNAPFDSWHYWTAADRCPLDAVEAAGRLVRAAPQDGPVLATVYFDPREAVRLRTAFVGVVRTFVEAGFRPATYAEVVG